jgi:hypothetical protein
VADVRRDVRASLSVGRSEPYDQPALARCL